jgi:hypothetical protein
VAAGYLIHKHNQNKRDRAIIQEEAAALEESQYPLQESRPRRRHSHSHTSSDDKGESREDRHERHRRRRSRERREREKWERENGGRDHGAPPKIHSQPPQPAMFPVQTQIPQPGGFPLTGWPSHWKQSQTPPVRQPPMNPNGYPEDVKYGFVPEVPHDQHPAYPPPPFSPGPSQPNTWDSRGRANTLEVNDGRRGRPKTRRSISPNLGEYDEYSRSPEPRVRFSTEDVVLGRRRGGRGTSDPPPYRA